MNKISLNNDSFEFIMNWCDKNLHAIERAPMVLPKYSLEYFVEGSLGLVYEAEWLNENETLFKVSYHTVSQHINFSFKADYRYEREIKELIEACTGKPFNTDGRTIPFVVHVSPLKDGMSFTADGEKYANLVGYIHIYVMFFMAHFKSELVEYEDKEVTKKVKKKSGKKRAKTARTVSTQVIRLNRFVYDIKTGKKSIPRKYTKCSHSFGVRGHYRHYKSGKSVWIAPYQKNTNKKENEQDKVYKFDFSDNNQEKEELS